MRVTTGRPLRVPVFLIATVLAGCAPASPSAPAGTGAATGAPSAVPSPTATRPEPTMPAGAPRSPWPTPSVTATIGRGSLPVSSGDAQLAPGPDGGLYLLVDGTRGTLSEPPSRAVIALLDSAGTPKPGWPVEISGWSCASPTPGVKTWQPSVAADGSLRVVCYADLDTDLGGHRLAFAFTPQGGLMAGWPVEISTADVWTQPVVAGGTLFVATHQIVGDASTGPYSMRFWIDEIAADGSARAGAQYATPSNVMPTEVLAPDGTLRLTALGDRTTTMAIGAGGPITGWPVVLDGNLSLPAFGPDGRTYLAQVQSGRTRTLVIARDGQLLPAGPVVPMEQASEWTGAGPMGGPAVPVVSPDGTVFLIAEAGGHLTVVGLDPAGKVMAGWPYTASAGLEWEGRCGFETVGCGVWRTRQAVGPGNVLYLLLAARDATVGGAITAIGPDGAVLPGWPIVLPDPGGMFRTVVADPDGTVYALAVDGPDGSASATILAIEPDGSVRYRVPIVAP